MPSSLLILTHEYLPKRAGIATFVSETAHAAWEEGWDVTILAPSYTPIEKKDRFCVLPTKVAGRQDWLDRLRMRQAVLELDINWSETTLWLPEPGPQRLWMYADTLGLPRPKAIILTLHGSEILRYTATRWRRHQFAKLLEKAQLISVVSKYTKGLLVSQYGPLGGRIAVTYGGVRRDLLDALKSAPSAGHAKDRIVLLTLARIHPRKAQDLVIEAIAHLPLELRQRITYRLVGAVGRKAYAAELKRRAIQLGVHLEGPITAHTAQSVANELRAADLMVLTSKEAPNSVESFGLVFLEAAAAGCPVLATASGGVREAISQESGCVLKEATITALQAKLQELFSEQNQLQQWRISGPAWARQFAWRKTAMQILGDGTLAAARSYWDNFFTQLDEELEAVEAVTLDVFDTVLQRVVFPKEVFAIVETRAVQAFGLDFNGFADGRVKAEASARKSTPDKATHREVTLEEIYTELSSQNPSWQAFVSRLLTMEWEEERRLSRPHPLGREIFRRVREAGKEVLFVSDMYLGKDRIAQLLQANGYENANVVCSADHLQSKDRGTLYPTVAKVLTLAPEQILHIGDNPKSDFIRAQAAGFKALAVRPPQKAPRHSKQFPKLQPSSMAAAISQGLITRKNYSHSIGAEKKHALGHHIGYTILGPFAYGLCRWLVKEIEKSATDLLLCLGRDGHMPYTILRKWQKDFGLLPDTRIEYFHCSRRACTLALAGDGMSPLVLKTLSQHRRSVPVKDYLERIGLDPENHLDVVVDAGFESLDEVVHRKDGRPQMEQLFKSLEEPLKALGRDEKEQLIKSLRIKGMDTAKAPALFDLGWRGTQQTALQAMLKDYPTLHGYYLSIANSLAANGTTHGYLVEDGKPELMRGALESAVPVLELLFSSPEPSFLYYTENAGEVTPVFDDSNPNSAEIESLHEGACSFVSDMAEIGQGPTLELSTHRAVAPFLGMALNPSVEQLNYLSRLVFSDALGKENPTILTKVKPPKLRDFIFDYQYFFERYSQTAWRAHFIQQMSVAARLWVTPWSPSFRRICKAIRTFGGNRT